MSIYEKRSDNKHYIYLKKQGQPSLPGRIHEITCLPNFHRASEFIIITNGNVNCNVNGKHSSLEAGDILFVDSFLPHSYVASNDVDGYVLVMSEWYLQFFRKEFERMCFPTVMSKHSKNKEIAEYVADWHLWLEAGKGTVYDGFNRANLFFALLYDAYSLVPMRLEKGNELVVNMLNYIDENYAEDISIEKIADEFGYAKQYCSKMFNKVVDESFRKYLNRVRVLRFREMWDSQTVKQRDTVLKLAFACGFESQSTFYRAYRELYGTTPKC
ncbi:helix-turn-helix transcriptional regulator [Pumilibacter intestinalis]|uniref:helix-turn-helix transcriptional regulator n=1 Tax=Pumilibacter intestinalis TaxID=2941511 RepID=UPI00203F8042|nr:AraC family transcriptional regulator [Pumilibacter intestinalis]